VRFPGLAAILLATAAAGSVALVAAQWAQPAPAATAGQICEAVADLQEALDLSSVGEQAALRARAAKLVDLLTDPAPIEGPTGSESVARSILTVLDNPRSTVADLAAAIAPVVSQCPA
jgi:hypothetical protein